uniref:Uncharacterized protein n=1 Tax=Arundo donax TaxID=35708 RepID=A0A0A9ABJ3_ARUDO
MYHNQTTAYMIGRFVFLMLCLEEYSM